MTRPEFDDKINPVSLKDTNLFKPFKLGNLDLKHRLVLAPLTRLRADPDTFVPNVELSTEYYSQRSQTPGSLLITEATIYSYEAGGYFDGKPGIWNQEQIEAWSKIFDKIHSNGSFVIQQLFHLGRQAIPDKVAEKGITYRAPTSGIYINDGSYPYEEKAKEFNTPLTEFTTAEVEEEVKKFVQGGINSIKAGADGVQIHAANGYLLNQFLDQETNKRTDKYGGSLENRSRFVLEIVDGLIEAIGAEKVSVRLSPWSQYGDFKGIQKDPELLAQYAHIVGELEKRRLDGKSIQFIDLVEPRIHGNKVNEESGVSKDSHGNRFIYDIWKGPIVRAGNYIQEVETLKKDVDHDDRTLIAVGRHFVSNPDLVERLEKGYPLTKYDRDTFYTSGETGYTDYPNYSA
ncbi:NADPH dehydrogenase 3 [Wickerhamomyces ciferrii]|uniref:NADPH dehydrogenase 3 n=1 Tax=Wickerhamomyces ciferrii (strain ATCC 14091 / BCRC 22168 / CBS 111 / JCM 3599 / NBRC 0793 / NRRL Y-1031 F-60-10) TaxID=1206466 RepID=K0KCD8_WICCF|nr:NADPH dehydrogenase 3 [Wickerhamomyces ciferrii]CCH42740.1 NADPH dehydrogenase 3 [Wickerhamomyces ciferrii]